MSNNISNITKVKVRVISLTFNLNGQPHTVGGISIGDVIDAVPIYGDVNNTITNYELEVSYFDGSGGVSYGWRSYPSELFLHIAKHREDQINSIFDE